LQLLLPHRQHQPLALPQSTAAFPLLLLLPLLVTLP
jgi:hypothetical protein